MMSPTKDTKPKTEKIFSFQTEKLTESFKLQSDVKIQDFQANPPSSKGGKNALVI